MSANMVEVAECWCLAVFGCDTEASAWQFRSATITCEQIGIGLTSRLEYVSCMFDTYTRGFDQGWKKLGFEEKN